MSAQDDTAAAATPEATPAAEETITTAATPPEGSTKADETTDGAEPPAADETEEGQERDEKGRFKPNRVQERIDELTRQKGEAAREAAYWRGVAEAGKPKTETPPPANDPTSRPKVEDFETYDDFTEALTDWKLDQRDQKRDATQRAEAQATTWQQRATAAKETLPDFEQVLSESTAPMTKDMAEVLRDSEHGPALAYHLAKNPAEAERIARLSPLAAAAALGRIEADLSKPAAPAAAPKKVTSAPTPPTPIGAGRSTEGDPAKMSYKDYEAWRDAQRKQQ